uniref:ubiquitinyl hydrolase 1 n=1 Tax=Oryza barthii TaxID=65489 RepID=A0A0D3EUJ2_9ORYZ
MVTPRAPELLQQDQDEEMLVPDQDVVVEGPQPMEDSGSTVENEQVPETSTSRFTWTIEDFSNHRKLYSDVFVVGGHKWRVLVFPTGNSVQSLSMYLDIADANEQPHGWSKYAQFSLAVINQLDSKYSLRKGDLYDPTKGYIVNDKCIIEAEVAVRKIVDFWNYDSKKETGYVGLKNQGATCYMNSLLQTLYHIPYFRKAVYHMPTTENDTPCGSIPLALQSLFCKLQHSDNSVSTKELTKSFGWDTVDSFLQHDVQELNRVLCEKLENKMKGTTVEGTIQQLFEGHHMNYIECINVDYKSTRKESFYDLALDVKGCSDVYASFDKYVEVERLEGDNKYQSEKHGLQDAKKGMLFIDFPPVLQLQLKRFEYDFVRDTMVKINDRYEFPLQLDLDKDDGKYLSPEADRRVRNLYTLHSVLVHSGGGHGGHYYAFIRPALSDIWYKFDDERVTKEDMKRALEEQYGGEEELPHTNPGLNTTPLRFTKHSNAYMLVYIRESDREKVICNLDENDIPEHLKIRLRKENEEREYKKKEKAEAHMFTALKVARDSDFAEQIGKHIYFDLVDYDNIQSLRAPKHLTINQAKVDLSKEFGIPVQSQRFWLWAKRQNHTFRPVRPLTLQEEASSIGHLTDPSNKSLNSELKLFLEVALGQPKFIDLGLLVEHLTQIMTCVQENHPISVPPKTKDDILIFFKLYDPEKEELRYVGKLLVKASGKPADIVQKLQEMAGFQSDEDIELYEEVMFEPSVMCEPININDSFLSSQLEDGDIICYQKRCSPEKLDHYRCADVPSFFEYIQNRQVVHFRLLENPKDDDFTLELSKRFTYDDVVEKVANQLGLDDPSKLRLTQHLPYSQMPKSHYIKYRGLDHLSDMLRNGNQMSDILYYEILDIPLPVLQDLITLRVAFYHATNNEVSSHFIRLPKGSTMSDLIEDMKSKVELSYSDAEFRLFEVYKNKIRKVYQPSEKISVNEFNGLLCVEEVPEEEKNAGVRDRLVHVCHFIIEKQHIDYYGEPFFFLIRDDETLSDIKVRIQKKLLVSDEQFAKWKFAYIAHNRLAGEYFQDSDIVLSRFQKDVYGPWEQCLGLEHSDVTPKRSCLSNQVYAYDSY